VVGPVHSTQKARQSAVIGLGLPSVAGKPKFTPRESHISQIFPDAERQDTQGLLAAAETSAVIDRQFAEVNKAKFFDLASTETVKTFSKLAQNSSSKFNPLKQRQSAPKPTGGQSKAKKRKPDIFD